jgi:hypothetical protein
MCKNIVFDRVTDGPGSRDDFVTSVSKRIIALVKVVSRQSLRN